LKILLPDAGRLQEEDADYKNRHNLTKHAPALPLYTEKDADASLQLIQGMSNIGERFPSRARMFASFSISGHILGSSLVLLEIEGAGEDRSGRRVLFSGDLGHYHQPIIKDPNATTCL
jgi:metallo-beta-lactamase family protein